MDMAICLTVLPSIPSRATLTCRTSDTAPQTSCPSLPSHLLKFSHLLCKASSQEDYVETKARGSYSKEVAASLMRKHRMPVEQIYNIRVEKNVPKERIKRLGVDKWSKWEANDCGFSWEWEVDQLVYVLKGSVKVTPENSEHSAYFYAGDLVRYPKWLVARLTFDEPYEERYRFVAYGDEIW